MGKNDKKNNYQGLDIRRNNKQEIMDYINTKYGSVENYVKEYKKGQGDEELTTNLTGIVLTEQEITNQQRFSCIDAIEKIIKRSLKPTEYIDYDALTEIIEDMREDERKVFELYSGILDGKPIKLHEINSMLEISNAQYLKTKAQDRIDKAIKSGTVLKDVVNNMIKVSELDLEATGLKELADETGKEKTHVIYGVPLKDLGLTLATINELKKANIVKIGDLKGISIDDLSITNRAKKEIIGKFKDIGIVDEEKKTLSELDDMGTTKNDTMIEGEDVSIDSLDFSARILHRLKDANIEKVSDIRGLTHDDLLRIKNVGKKDVQVIMDKLRDLGMPIKGDDRKDTDKQELLWQIERCKKEQKQLLEEIGLYYSAYEFYSKGDNIFDPNAKVPTKSELSNDRKAKENQAKELISLNRKQREEINKLELESNSKDIGERED